MKIPFVLFIISLFLSTGLYSMSADELVETALKNNHTIKAMYHKRQGAEQDAYKESIFMGNPVFSFAYSNVPIPEFPALDAHPMSGINLGITQQIAFPWEATLRKRMFRQKWLTEGESYREARNMLARDVQAAHAGLMFMYERLRVLEANKKTMQDMLRVAESMVSVNRMPSSNLLKIRAEISDLENQLLETEGIVTRGEEQLEQLCGVPLDRRALRDSARVWIDEGKAGESPGGFLAREHPLYKKVDHIAQAESVAENMEIAKLVPGVTVGAEYRIRQPIAGKDMGEDFITLKASIPIPLLYPLKERHQIMAARERARSSRELLRNVETELTSAWEGEVKNHENLSAAFRNYNSTVLPMYWSVYQSQLASLSAGEISLIDVLDSYRRFLGAGLEKARLYRDLSISRIKLNYLLNRYPGQNETSENKETGEK